MKNHRTCFQNLKAACRKRGYTSFVGRTRSKSLAAKEAFGGTGRSRDLAKTLSEEGGGQIASCNRQLRRGVRALCSTPTEMGVK